MQKQNLEIIEKFLNKIYSEKFKDQEIVIDLDHAYKLRRQLLSCDYYSDSFIKRFVCKILMHKNELLRLGFVFSFILVVFISSSFGLDFDQNNNIAKSQSVHHHLRTKYVNSTKYNPKFLQELYKYGVLNYSHQDTKGNRIYKAKTDKTEIIVLDKKPYKIDLVIAN